MSAAVGQERVNVRVSAYDTRLFEVPRLLTYRRGGRPASVTGPRDARPHPQRNRAKSEKCKSELLAKKR
jgi:hypothetical protein